MDAPDPKAALDSARIVALVDWRAEEVPAALLARGLEVFSLNVRANTATAYAWDGRLVMTPMPERPTHADILCVFRPAEEQPALARLGATLGIRVFWVDEGASVSEEAQAIAEEAGMAFIASRSIAAVAAGR